MNTNEKFVITISREIGSGGRTVGRKLAQKLGVRFCDKELINALREKFSLSASEIERIKGEKKNWLADMIRSTVPSPEFVLLNDPNSAYLNTVRVPVTTDEIFEAETEILKELAAESSCVIAGRSGFFVLKDVPNKVDIMLVAPRDKRIARVAEKQNLTPDKAALIVDSVDKSRENYVKRYTGNSRYDLRNYDLVLNVDDLSEDEVVDIILAYLKAL
ncbi:MAG: cytidylate kinase-like family protein [Bacteroidales bacterium]|nr:cytidylate kinase-like family protein [Bacteroidales bacterium]